MNSDLDMVEARREPVGFQPALDMVYFAGAAKLAPSESKILPDEYLFCEGDLKSHVYRVESGIICVSAGRAGGPPEIVEIVGPGNFVGLGFLKHFIHSAKAVVESTVTCWPRSAISELIASNETQLDRQADATEREFAHRRRALVGQPRTSPIQKVAAFLIAVSRLNEVEGRDWEFICDTLDCGVVAKYLDMDIDTLRSALVELQADGLIEPAENSALRIIDRYALVRRTALAWQMHGDN